MASDLTSAAAVIDGDNTVGWASSTGACFFGLEFPEGKVAVVSEIQYFMNKYSDRNYYVDNLKIVGYNNGVGTTIYTVDSSIHEGWNYIKFDTEQRYDTYKFEGAVTHSCEVGEIKLIGIVVLDDNNPTYSCTPEAIINSVSIPLPISQVTYASDSTPVLTANISPRYGSIIGGDTITFTGERFPTTGTFSIEIDGVPCTNIVPVSTTSLTCDIGERT